MMEVDAVKTEDFTLTLDDDVVPCRLFTPDAATKEYCVLWLQGWSSSMDSHREGVMRMSEKSGVTFATLDYAGHGLHKVALEDSTRKQQHEEVVAVYDELKKRGYQKIIAIGGSFGAYMAALLAAKRTVHALVLRAPANYPDEDFDLRFSSELRSYHYSDFLNTKESDDLLAKSAATLSIQKFQGHVYVLEHELDEVVAAKVPRHYFAAARRGNYLIVPKTKHSPKTMPRPEAHYKYIEHLITSIIGAVQLQASLTDE